jgi:hypothetical protein
MILKYSNVTMIRLKTGRRNKSSYCVALRNIPLHGVTCQKSHTAAKKKFRLSETIE